MVLFEIGLFFGGFAAGLALMYYNNIYVERKATSLYMQAKGAKGQEVRQQNEARLEQALFEAVTLFKTGKTPVDIAKELLPKYPDVALKLGKKLASEGMNIDSLLQEAG